MHIVVFMLARDRIFLKSLYENIKNILCKFLQPVLKIICRTNKSLKIDLKLRFNRYLVSNEPKIIAFYLEIRLFAGIFSFPLPLGLRADRLGDIAT